MARIPTARRAVAAILAFAASLSCFLSVALADQRDERLDTFFSELKDASPSEAVRISGRVLEVWAEADSATAQLLFNRATEAEYAREYELAEELLGHVTGLAPTFAEGWAVRGRIRLARADVEGASADFEKALTLEPRHYPTQLLVAQLRLSLDDERGALRAYVEALSWNPHLDGAKAAVARLERRLQGQGI